MRGRLNRKTKAIIRECADLPERPNLSLMRWESLGHSVRFVAPGEEHRAWRVLMRWERMKWGQAFREKARQAEAQRIVALEHGWRAEAV